ncbi:MAG: hypothetical protein R2911_10925 [Caldilineaceae bacterium]
MNAAPIGTRGARCAGGSQHGPRQAEIARAALEKVAFNLRLILDG